MTANNERSVDYWFAPQSPWTFLGHARFAALADRLGVEVSIKPLDAPKMFAASGGLPLAQRPAQRQAYRLVELRRFSAALDVPLRLHPKFFPVAGDAAARMILAAMDARGTHAAMTLIGAIGAAVWTAERDIADEARLIELADAHQFDGRALAAASKQASIQQRYERNTQTAIATQVFGVPTYVPQFGPHRGELFWGQDRLDFLERALQSG